MAKLIQYRPDTYRKLGFRKVKKESLEQKGQLTLFDRAKIEETIQILRHLDPFEKGLRLDEKNPALAKELYLEAISQGISVADAHCNLGILYAREGETAKAIASFTKALSSDPTHLEGHYNLANMYYDAGNHPLAVMHYQVALELDGVFPEIYFNLALAYVSLDRRDDAMGMLRAFLQHEKKEEDKDEASMLLKLLEADIKG